MTGQTDFDSVYQEVLVKLDYSSRDIDPIDIENLCEEKRKVYRT